MGHRKVADRIEVVQGDITRQKVDTIVNAANETLLGGQDREGLMIFDL